MVWPTASIPTYGRGVWLECNGQSFDRNRFPQLYETLRTTRVPDYQGVFLRGYGSQSYSQNNGDEKASNQIYSSGSIGAIQGDAIRHDFGFVTGVQGTGYGLWTNKPFVAGAKLGMFYHLIPGDSLFGMEGGFSENGLSSYPMRRYYAGNDAFSSNSSNDLNEGWYDALTKYKYTMSCSSSDDGEGGSSTSCELNEEEIHPTLDFTHLAEWSVYDNSLTNPVSTEIRPINVAVKFMIKAK